MEFDKEEVPSPPNPLSQDGRRGKRERNEEINPDKYKITPTPLSQDVRKGKRERNEEIHPDKHKIPPTPLSQDVRKREINEEIHPEKHKITPTPLSQDGRKGKRKINEEIHPEKHKISPTPLSQKFGRGAGGEGKKYKDRWEIPPVLRQRMIEVARQFRKNPMPSEAILWEALRHRKLEGRKFRRQQPIGNFIVDFFCGSERLIVEIDGKVHESQKDLDIQRQELLESLGLRFLRLNSDLVETNLPVALELIRQTYIMT